MARGIDDVAELKRVRWTEGDLPQDEAPSSRATIRALFQNHIWMESGETVRDEVMLRIPEEDASIYRINLRLVIWQRRPFRDRTPLAINAVRIVQGLVPFTDEQWSASIPIEGENAA